MNQWSKIIFILFFNGILFFTNGYSQSLDYSHYTPLKCAGSPPADFLKTSYEKYYKDVAEIKNNKNASKDDKILQKEFSFITNYKIDEILMSGKVLYGNKVSNYINKIADKLLDKEPELKSKMRFYLLNVSYANALCTNNGIVFVTTGLIAQLENEAQLAFVLSHEISHFKLNHSLESFKKTKDILVDKKYDDMDSDEKILKILKYSKENESEADVEGLKLFTKAGYDKNESVKMMDILLYSHLPFDEIPFPRTFFNDSFYKIPKVFFPDSITEISAMEDEDDEESSHPNIEFRKLHLERYIQKTDKGKLFLFPLNEFEEVLKLSRFELGYLLIVKGNYAKAFYHSFLLEKVYGEGDFTAELMAGSLYGLNKNKLNANLDDYDEVNLPEKDFEGQISIPYNFFNAMKGNEFNVMVARKVYAIYKNHPTKYNYNVACDVFKDLLYGNKFSVADFKRKPELMEPEVVDTISSDKETQKSTPTKKVISTKIRKIKRSRSFGTGPYNAGYYKNAFILNYFSSGFIGFVDSIENKVIDLKKKEDDMRSSQLRSEPIKRYTEWLRNEKKIQNKFGKQLGIDSLIVIAPSYSSIHYNFKETDSKTDNIGDELKSIDFSEYIEKCANDIGISIDLIDINRRSKLSSEQMNEFSILNSWIGEKYTHTDMNDQLFSQKYVDSLVLNKGYKNVCLSGFTLQHIKFGGHLYFLGAVVFPPLILGPLIVNENNRKLDYFYLVLNMQTGAQEMLAITSVHRWPKAAVFGRQMSYTLYQTKARKK